MKIKLKNINTKRSIISILVMLLLVLSSITSEAFAESVHIKEKEEIVSCVSLKTKSGGFENSYRYYGDVNNDAKINMLDVTLIQKNIAKLKKFDITSQIASDVNSSQYTDMVDIVIIQRYVASLTKSFPAGKLFHVIN